MNGEGLEVISLLLSTEVSGGSNDSTTKSIADLNSYDLGGLDSSNNRMNPRKGIEFFRGEPITSWPISDRRRAVIINGVAHSPSHAHWEIAYNEEFPNSTSMINAINSISAPLPAQDFSGWAASFSFPIGLATPGSDPDRDGSDNLTEFFAGTHPLNGGSAPVNQVKLTPEGILFRFQIATDRAETPYQFQMGTLDHFVDISPEENDISITVDGDGREILSVMFPPGSGPFFRISLTHP